MTHREKVTIVVAWFNLVEDKRATNDMIDNYIRDKSEPQLEWMKNHMIVNYTSEQMIQAADKFAKE